MSYTPGPWIAEEVGMSSAGDDGVPVYEVSAGNGYKRVCEHVSESDARLIAAAPELVEALEQLHHIFYVRSLSVADWDKSAALLARIRGDD